MNENPTLKIKSIKEGTVIDHIQSNKAMYVMNILNLPNKDNKSITVAMNVVSKAMGRKDILKIEERALDSNELDQVALIAPNATINIIHDYKLVKKDKISLKNEINGIIKCTNPRCITNSNQNIESKFSVLEKSPTVLRCYYCEKVLDSKDIDKQFK